MRYASIALVVLAAALTAACDVTKDVLLGPEVTPTPVASAAPTETPWPTPTPWPTETPMPTPTPDPDPGHFPDNVPDNTNPVDHVHLIVYFVECDGETLPGDFGTAAVGCRVHFDATPKDRTDRHTRSSVHSWSLTGPAQFGGLGSLTPTALGTGPGVITARVTVDGVVSNAVTFTFTN